ncbi:MAG: Hsp20/alpha crystallin family protein [Brevinematia bacterium]
MAKERDFFRMILSFGTYNVVRPNVHWIPPVDVYEFVDKVVILVELPGVEKEDIDITLKNGFLRISGVRKEMYNENRVRIHQMEISYGYFERIVEVGEVNEKNIKADLKDGILTITIFKY